MSFDGKKQRMWLHDMLPIDSLSTDGFTIKTRSGWLVRLYQIKGQDSSLHDAENKQTAWQQRFSWIMALPENVAVRIFCLHTPCNKMPFLTGNLSTAEKYHYETTWFALISLPADSGNISLFSKEKNEDWPFSLNGIMEILAKQNLIPIDSKFLEGRALTGFWQGILHGDWQGQELFPNVSFSQQLNPCDIFFAPSSRRIHIESSNQKRIGAILGIRSYAAQTRLNQLDRLLELPISFHQCHSFWPESRVRILERIRLRRGRLIGFGGFQQGNIENLDNLANEIEKTKTRLFAYHLTINIWADDEAELNSSIQQIQTVLLQEGIATIEESWNIWQSYWGQFPEGENLLRARRVYFSGENIADIVNFQSGERGDETIPALLQIPRFDSGSYRFTIPALYDAVSAGHLVLVGGSGSGKTTWLSLLVQALTQQKNLSRILVFDSGKGLRKTIDNLDGLYCDLSEEKEKYGFNPLIHAENTLAEKDFLTQWLSLLAGEVNEAELPRIQEAIRQNFLLEPELRNLSELRWCFVGRKESAGAKTLYERLQPWFDTQPSSGFLARLIQGDIFHSFAFQKKIQAFDLGALLSRQVIDGHTSPLAPIVATIFHRFDKVLSELEGSHFIIMDEAARYLEDPLFGDKMRILIRERRKQRGIVIAAFQEASSLTNNKQGRVVLENSESLLLFPSNHIDAEIYGPEGLGLGSQEIELLRNPPHPRAILLKPKYRPAVLLNATLEGITIIKGG
jgi:type IV secretion system protein VirB4